MKALIPLPTIANVAPGNTVTVSMPVGNVYEKLYLYYTNATAAQLKNIILEANGRMISEWPDGARLLSIDAHYKRTAVSGCLVFNFTRDELHNLQQRRFFGFDTSASQGITLANLKLDIDAAATGVTLKAYCERSQAVQGVPNFLTKVRRFIVPVSATGEFDVDNIPRPAGASIAAMHLYMGGNISKARLLVNNTDWHDIPAAIAADIQTAYGRNPQTVDATVIDLTLDGDIQQAVPLNETIQDMRLRATATATGQVEVMVEYIDQYGAGRF